MVIETAGNQKEIEKQPFEDVVLPGAPQIKPSAPSHKSELSDAPPNYATVANPVQLPGYVEEAAARIGPAGVRRSNCSRKKTKKLKAACFMLGFLALVGLLIATIYLGVGYGHYRKMYKNLQMRCWMGDDGDDNFPPMMEDEMEDDISMNDEEWGEFGEVMRECFSFQSDFYPSSVTVDANCLKRHRFDILQVIKRVFRRGHGYGGRKY